MQTDTQPSTQNAREPEYVYELSGYYVYFKSILPFVATLYIAPLHLHVFIGVNVSNVIWVGHEM